MADPHHHVGITGTEAELGPLSKALLTDVTKCIGCEKCVQACTRVNKLDDPLPTGFRYGDGLSGQRYTAITEIPGPEEGTWRAVRRQCMHCQDPSCAAACLVGAFTRRADGPVVYDAAKCIGCRYCMLACPFKIPRYQYERQLPIIAKCRMDERCRVEGGMPSCVSACPTEATIFGPREMLLAEARRRIEAEPDKYIDHVWGEHEFGGTSVMYISDVPLDDALEIPTDEELEHMGVGELSHESIPHLVHTWVLVTPVQFAVVGSGLFGAWFMRRRQLVMAEEAKKKADATPKDATPKDSTPKDSTPKDSTPKDSTPESEGGGR